MISRGAIRFTIYLEPYAALIGDRRTWITFTETVKGIVASGSLVCQPIATHSPVLGAVKAVSHRPGLTPQRRGILYHRLFSSTAADFVSEPHEVQQALTTVSKAIAPLQAERAITWIVDSGFDDVAVWRTLWEQQHVVCRMCHTDRVVQFPAAAGGWQSGSINQARTHMRRLTQTSTTRDLPQPRTGHTKPQTVVAEIWATPIRLTYATNVRRPGPGAQISKPLWLLEIRMLSTKLDPWLLLTDWMVETATRGFVGRKHAFGLGDLAQLPIVAFDRFGG